MIKINITRRIKDYFSLVLSSFRKRDDNLYVFGSWYGEKFADNPKYLFLYYLSMGKSAYWITKEQEVFQRMKDENLPVLLFDSKEGKNISKKAKYFFYCCSLYDFNWYYAAGAVTINLWHGIPLKKIMYDDKYNYNTGNESFYSRITDKIIKRLFSKNYVVTTSRVMSQIYKSAFRLDESHILNLGQPRNDCFFDSSIPRVKYSNIEYDKLITYMPTMRNMGNTKIDIEEIFDLKKLDDLCKQHNVLFLIKKHFCHRNEKTDLSDYSNIIDLTSTTIDTQELLYNTDVLITDYSSCYIDFLLLGRPIVFYAYDLLDYLKKDREMYFAYEDVAPGAIVKTFPDLYDSICTALNGDNTDKRYEQIRNLFYDPENQKIVSPRIASTVDSLS